MASTRPRRWGYVLIVLLAFLVAGSMGAYRMALGTIAPTSGVYYLDGLDGEIRIRFDAFERPFIEAESFEDVLVAEGWLHASHRLWQMELLRRAGSGRLAELLGSSLLDSDKELWRQGVPQLAGQLQANASPWMLAAVERYVSGVNAALSAGVATPLEFLLLGYQPERWRVEDVFALGAIMAFQTSNNAGNELLRMGLIQAVGEERAAIFLPDETRFEDFPYIVRTSDDGMAIAAVLKARETLDPLEQWLMPQLGFGSNGWVVGASKSASGRTLFAFDSHDGLALPNLFYEFHAFYGDGEMLRGWSVPGLPGVINGYNSHIAWGFTTIGDSQDLVLEERSPDDPLQFLGPDGWYAARIERVEIPVSGKEGAESLEIIYTQNGPLISEEPPLALRWTAHDLGGLGMDSILQLNLAKDWTAFNEALDRFPAPALNAHFASINGDIGVRTAGLFPVRGKGEGLVPVHGADPEAIWQGIVPPETLPRSFNPPEGFVAAANARTNAPGDGPLVSADNAPGYRMRRIVDVLRARNDFEHTDMAALQVDWFDGQAALVLPALLEGLAEVSLEGPQATARDMLEAWLADPVATPDSAGAIIFQAWYRHLAEAVFKPALPDALYGQLLRHAYPLNHALDRLILHEPESPWWQEQRGALMAEALEAALDEIAAVQGTRMEDWRLDAMHKVILKHEMSGAAPFLDRFLDAAPAPWGGSTSTVGRARYRYDRAYDISGAATIRTVAEVGAEGMKLWAVMPAGQSGHPLSRHYLDQLPHWLNGELIPLAKNPGAVAGPLLELLPGP